MRLTQDYILLKLDKKYNDEIKTENLTLILPEIERQGDEQDVSYEPNKNKRIWGEIISLPTKISNLPLKEISVGRPQPKAYVSSEIIETYPGFEKSDYNPSTYEPQYIRLCDLPFTGMVGQRAYVHYDALTEDNQVEPLLYKVRIDSIICTVDSAGLIYMQTGHTLIAPDMQTEEDIKTPTGIFMQANVNPKPLRGWVIHVRNDNELGLKGGENIYYMLNADWEVEIENKTYYVIKEEDIIAVIDGKSND